MKYVLIICLVLIGVLVGLTLTLGHFEGFGVVLGMFVLFPLIYIFGTIFIGKNKKEKEIDTETKKKDRFSRWE